VSRVGSLAIAAFLSAVSSAAGETRQAAVEPASRPAADEGLVRFRLEKSPEEVLATSALPRPSIITHLPKQRDALRTTVGGGYVQGADWGTELIAAGAVRGIQTQFDILLTQGREGLLVDRGSLSLFDPDRNWRVEAGDIFSGLRGASRGARFSWQLSRGRRPAISVYGHRPGVSARPAVLAYRDQIVVREQTLLDAEIATDRSYLLRSQLAHRRFDVETSYRRTRFPISVADSSLSGGLTLARGLVLTLGAFRSELNGDRSDWRLMSLRVPISRGVALTFERAYSTAAQISNVTSAMMANVVAGDLRLFHRHQFGEYDFARQGLSTSLERQQTQSMAGYTAGQWLNLTLQLATQRTDVGRIEHWEELQSTVRLTRTTTLTAVTAMPDVTNARRMRAYFRQELPARFALQADYGRLSAFQAVPHELDRSRFKLMLYKTWDVGTPVRGAAVTGRVVDHAQHPVAGALVRLGPYSVETDATGKYLFRNVPGGDYALSLDPQHLPADYAWDGRHLRLALKWSSRIDADLLVAPLNAIHGRVFCDRNANGRFDLDEGVAGVVMHLGDRVTATDQRGAYSFYNLQPGQFVVRLNADRLPPDLQPGSRLEIAVELGDNLPVTNADFQVGVKTKPIIWTSTP